MSRTVMAVVFLALLLSDPAWAQDAKSLRSSEEADKALPGGAMARNLPSEVCPTYESVSQRIQARAEYLKQHMPLHPKLALMRSGTTPNVIVALATVVAARAKEEARLWLVDQLVHQICDDDSSGSYFSNTCGAVVAGNEYPGPSMTLLKTKLRQDLYAMPACYVYQQTQNRVDLPSADTDSAIDAYLVEAIFVALHERSKGDDPETNPNAPSLQPPPNKEELATLLILALFGDQLPDQWPEKQTEAFITIQAHLVKTLDVKAAALTQRIVRAMRDLSAWPTSSPENQWDKLSPQTWAYVKTILQLEAAYTSAAQGNYVEVALGAGSQLFCQQNATTPLCARLALLGEIASAEGQEEMEAALDRFISPLGSWRRKQAENMWSLNAMAGVAVGSESLKLEGEQTRHTTAGVYMPIGIERSWNVQWGPYIRSVAVGATALDLGGVLSYSEESELQGGETSSSANVELSSVVSPGLYFAVAFKNSPFRMGLSASRTPDLRSVKFDDATETSVDSKRYMFFVAVDVTLLGF